MKNNPRISHKERGLIKGALRRVFSRSDLRKEALEATRIKHEDHERKRVTKWSACAQCKTPTPTYKIDIDHKIPVQPLGTTIDEMGADELITNIWCPLEQLQGLCETCHDAKSKEENATRREIKKQKKLALQNESVKLNKRGTKK